MKKFFSVRQSPIRKWLEWNTSADSAFWMGAWVVCLIHVFSDWGLHLSAIACALLGFVLGFSLYRKPRIQWGQEKIDAYALGMHTVIKAIKEQDAILKETAEGPAERLEQVLRRTFHV